MASRTAAAASSVGRSGQSGSSHLRHQPVVEGSWPADHDLRLVAGHRSPDRHRRHQRPDRGRQHPDQAHQTDRTGLPQRAPPLQRPYPPGRCRPTRGMSTPLSAPESRASAKSRVGRVPRFSRTSSQEHTARASSVISSPRSCVHWSSSFPDLLRPSSYVTAGWRSHLTITSGASDDDRDHDHRDHDQEPDAGGEDEQGGGARAGAGCG